MKILYKDIYIKYKKYKNIIKNTNENFLKILK